jgi:excisionase family DNA binding protein
MTDTALLTVSEVARLLQISEGWVRDHATGRRQPDIKSIRLGRSIRFRYEDIVQFIEECSNRAA